MPHGTQQYLTKTEQGSWFGCKISDTVVGTIELSRSRNPGLAGLFADATFRHAKPMEAPLDVCHPGDANRPEPAEP